MILIAIAALGFTVGMPYLMDNSTFSHRPYLRALRSISTSGPLLPVPLTNTTGTY